MHQNVIVSTAFLGIFLCALPAAAQSTAILGRDDAAFARELYSHGWTDLAEGVVRAFEKLDKDNKADPLDLLDVQAVGLDLRLDLARREPDLAKRKQAIAEIVAAKEKLVADSPRTKVGRETRDNLPDAYRMLGEALTALLAKETDSSALAALKAEGETVFARAESDLEDRLNANRELRLEENHTAEDLQYMNALFNKGRTKYFHSRFYPPGDDHGNLLLKAAITTFEELGLDYSDRLLNFEGIYHIGLCHKALGQSEDALGDWEYIVKTMREGFEVDARDRHQFTPEVADLVSKCVLQQMLVLSELKRAPEAIALADDFWSKTLDPELAASGLAVLASKADLQIDASDTAAAGETAKRLIALDPQGPWGNKGRELMVRLIGGASGPSIGPAEILRVAQNLSSQGRPEQALDAAQQAMTAAKGDAKEQDYGSQALLLMGQIYQRKQWFHEASLIFDTAYERYPKGDATPDAIASAMTCYSKLNAAEKRPFYKSRMQERGQTLVRDFPNHRAASLVQQAEARGLKEEGKYLEAAQLFRAVPSTAVGYAEAQVQAGSCLCLQGRTLIQEKKADEAKALFKEGEAVLVKALAEIATAKGKSLDQQVLAGLSSAEYLAVTTLARLYLEDVVNKPDQAMATLKGTDERFGSDPVALESIWQLRIRALEKLGNVDEAVDKFDELLRKQSDHASLSGAAGVLARSLDQRALELAKQPNKTEAAMRYWYKAVGYYVLSVQPQLDNHTIARPIALDQIAKRLLDLGMQFNAVPEDSNSFVGWVATKPLDKAPWEAAAKVYEAVVELDPANYRARICYGRVLGFLQRWQEAASAFASLFEQEPLVKADKLGFDAQVLGSKPELLNAYMEWGVCESEAGLAEKAADRQGRASGIFDLLVKGTTQGSALWWNSKYRQINTLLERGMYEPADVAMRNLERSTAKDFGDAPAGLKQELVRLKTEISKMVRPK